MTYRCVGSSCRMMNDSFFSSRCCSWSTCRMYCRVGMSHDSRTASSTAVQLDAIEARRSTSARRTRGHHEAATGSNREQQRVQARRSTCLLLPAVQRRRVESLVLGAHSHHIASTPRALVLVLGTNIAVLLDCSKSSRQCSLPSFLTYLLSADQESLAEAVSVHSAVERADCCRES